MRWTLVFSGLVQGIWMLVDAFQLMRHSSSRLSSGEVWDRMVQSTGLNPVHMGPVLLVLGVLWLGVTMALASGMGRAYRPAIVIACASLWYLLPGTIVAVIFLYALSTMRGRLQGQG